MSNIKIELLKKTIKTFDIILCTTNSQFSFLINCSQNIVNGRGKYTHVALCIKGSDLPKFYTFDDKNTNKTYKIDENEIYIFESVIDTKLESKNIFGEHFDGVQMRKFDETFEKYFELQSQGIFTELAYSPLNTEHNIRPEITYSVINKYLGTPYNNSFVDKLYVPFRENIVVSNIKYIKDCMYGDFSKHNGFLCTTLVGQTLKDVGLIDNKINHHAILTEDFVFNTWSKTLNKFPQIYLEPTDIIE